MPIRENLPGDQKWVSEECPRRVFSSGPKALRLYPWPGGQVNEDFSQRIQAFR